MSDDKQMTSEEVTALLRDGGDSLLNVGVATFYVRSGDGKMYREVPRADGSFDYVEADPNQEYHELEDGRFVVMRDVEEAQRQRQASSHRRYFEALAADPKTARRTMKRQDALRRQLEQLVIDRAVPVMGPKIEFIKDEQFLALSEMYRRAVAAGQGRECEFQPLSTYAHKLTTKSGAVVRPLYQGEVGMKGDTIVCLEPGYGTGSTVQVGDVLSGQRVNRSGDWSGDDRGGAGVAPVPGAEGGGEAP